jgi:hypothetical protein
VLFVLGKLRRFLWGGLVHQLTILYRSTPVYLVTVKSRGIVLIKEKTVS